MPPPSRPNLECRGSRPQNLPRQQDNPESIAALRRTSPSRQLRRGRHYADDPSSAWRPPSTWAVTCRNGFDYAIADEVHQLAGDTAQGNALGVLARVAKRVPDAAQRKREGWLLEPHTLRMLLLLLNGTGLRISEAVRLSLADLDLSAGVFTIRESKFYKSRFVPVGRDLLKALRHYIVLQWPAGALGTTPLLGTRKGNRVTRQQAEKSFQCLRKEAGQLAPLPIHH